MVAFIVETGSNNPNSNSYVSVEFADDYFMSHPFYSVNWEELPTQSKQSLLMYSSQSIDNQLPLAGRKSFVDQSMRFPRQGLLDSDGCLISQTTIPQVLKQAVCEIAVSLTFPSGNPDKPSESGGLSELKLDVITLKFESSTAQAVMPSAARRLLKGLYPPDFNPRIGRVQVRV